ncbi:hypothetical protein MNBD_GAMMA23-1999 [hydrothermal vent metagenome]|uniref:Transglutaminase-like domain-containing protein n=1 Tax=hydrothermal vent metagenome TaxID=652676 RepID=A0A3B0ZVN3_9ZZZZ
MMVKRSLILCLLAASLIFSAGVFAQQQPLTKFSQQRGAVSDYQYTFRNAAGLRDTLRFTLDDYYVQQSKRRFNDNKRRALFVKAKKTTQRIYDELQDKYNQRLKAEYSQYLMAMGARLPEGFKLNIKEKEAGWRLSYRGTLPQQRVNRMVKAFRAEADREWAQLSGDNRDAYQQESQRLIARAVPQLYKRNLYIAKRNKVNQSILEVRIDFAQVIIEETLGIRPMAKAIANKTRGLSDRDVIAYALRFLQLIPYDNLKSRNAMGSIGFVAPLTLIDINRGDCDTKSAALAALVRNLLPDVRMAMVLVPGHAFLALDIPSKNSDSTINVDGRHYVVVEPTGPALSPVGRAHPNSRPYLTVEKEQIKFLLSIPSGNENNIASVF